MWGDGGLSATADVPALSPEEAGGDSATADVPAPSQEEEFGLKVLLSATSRNAHV